MRILESVNREPLFMNRDEPPDAHPNNDSRLTNKVFSQRHSLGVGHRLARRIEQISSHDDRRFEMDSQRDRV